MIYTDHQLITRGEPPCEQKNRDTYIIYRPTWRTIRHHFVWFMVDVSSLANEGESQQTTFSAEHRNYLPEKSWTHNEQDNVLLINLTDLGSRHRDVVTYREFRPLASEGFL